MAAQTQPVRDKISELDRQIDDLQRKLSEALHGRRLLQEVLAAMVGEEPAQPEKARGRATNVKQVVLLVMERAGVAGLTSAEVLAAVQSEVPNAQRDTVSSLLSRLKKDGALAYVGVRYFDARYAPKEGESHPFRPHVQVVS
jgi:hypothetical protein